MLLRLSLLLMLWSCAATAQPQPKLFDYEASAPFAFEERVFGERPGVRILEVSYASPRQGTVPAHLVFPNKSRGKPAGIIFQHGGGQSRLTYLSEAAALARYGAVCLVTDAPGRESGPPAALRTLTPEQMRDWFVQVTVDLRRGIDLLAKRPDIDPLRMAYVGHSFGANTGAVLAAIDKRLKAIVLVGGTARITDHIAKSPIPYWTEWRKAVGPERVAEMVRAVGPVDPVHYLPQSAPAMLLVQCGRFDTGVTIEDCNGVYEAAAEPKQIRWYDCEHDFADLDVITDRIQWLRRNLRLN